MKTEEQPIVEKDYEYALQALNDEAFRQSEEFITWLDDESHRTLFREMADSREALMNLTPEMAPDVDKAWNRINPRPATSRRKRFYIWAASAAAVALLVTAYSIFSDGKEKTYAEKIAIVYPASDKVQEVELQTNEGRTMLIADRENKQLLEQTGARLNAGTLIYQKVEETGETMATHTLSTPRGKQFKVVLEDGTEVWLNAESKLHYPQRFAEDERRVELEGEAFFHVAKDAARPFIVQSGTAETRVLGTEFNFRSYPQESRHVTLVSGSVIVSDSRKENNLQLKPGEDVTLDENDGLLVPRKADVNEFTAWKEDLFCFREEKLIDIMKAIGRWYNLEIVFTDEAAMHYHFNFWAQRTDPPEEVLKLLNGVGKVKAGLEGNRITISKL